MVTKEAFFFVHTVMTVIPDRGVNRDEMRAIMTARGVVETVPAAFRIVRPPGRCEVSHGSGGS